MNPVISFTLAKSPDILQISQRFALDNPRILAKDHPVFQGDCDFNLNENDVIILVDTQENTSLFDIYGLERELSDFLHLNVKVLTQRNLAQIVQTQIERQTYPIQATRVLV